MDHLLFCHYFSLLQEVIQATGIAGDEKQTKSTAAQRHGPTMVFEITDSVVFCINEMTNDFIMKLLWFLVWSTWKSISSLNFYNNLLWFVFLKYQKTIKSIFKFWLSVIS